MTDPILSSADRVIEAFGGIRPMAKKVGVAVTTIQGWKERGTIPMARLEQVRDAAKREGIDLSAMETAGGETAADRNSTEAKRSTASVPPSGSKAENGGSGKTETVAAEKTTNQSGPRVKAAPSSRPTVDQKKAPRPRRARAFAFGAGVAVILLIGAVAGWYVTANLLNKDSNGADVSALNTRLSALEKQNATLKTRVEGMASLQSRMKKAEAEIKSVSATVAKATGGAGPALGKVTTNLKSLRDELNKMAARIDKIGTPTKPGADGIASKAALVKMATDIVALSKQVAALKTQKTVRSPTNGAAAGTGTKAIDEAIAQNGAAIAALRKDAATLGARVEKAATAALNGSNASTSLGTRLQIIAKSFTGFGQRLSSVETSLRKIEATGGQASAEVMAIAQLRSQVISGQPFKPALDAARTLTKGNPAYASALKALSPMAATGVPTLSTLRQRFDAISVTLIRDAQRARGQGWLSRRWNEVRSTVVVRRTGRGVKGTTPNALVSRAEVKLRDGDLAGAVALVSALPKTPGAAGLGKAAAAWIIDARKRLVADVAAKKLSVLAALALKPGKSGSGTAGSGKPQPVKKP